MMLVGMASQPSAWADPPTFPDMSRYTPVNSVDYEVDASTPGIHARQVVFLTPDGITCDFMMPPAAICTGNNFPSVPPATTGLNSIGTDYGLAPIGSGIPQTNNLRTLPPFHTLTVNGVTCGVDDKRTTACKDSQGHGFVLSPNGSGWLPQV
ncbi:hypothetical protein TL10_05640 [Mycolicibacterium llatzerense]|uniref:Uncharacterized protein n=2 Tax=Mycolicibacterium llatzerense TaxID=280871 RepID=A0A0D1LH03_9MYCO|nr:hypothetical protein TL10_05640 [Mycolicibacterium llatzerense]